MIFRTNFKIFSSSQEVKLLFIRNPIFELRENVSLRSVMWTSHLCFLTIRIRNVKLISEHFPYKHICLYIFGWQMHIRLAKFSRATLLQKSASYITKLIQLINLLQKRPKLGNLSNKSKRQKLYHSLFRYFRLPIRRYSLDINKKD